MKIEPSQHIIDLCRSSNIKSFKEYITRNPWKMRKELIEKRFLNKKGVYCFWWDKSKNTFSRDLDFSFQDHVHDNHERFNIKHDLKPWYIGMTAHAAYLSGSSLRGRIVDRLIRFPKIFSAYTEKGVMPLRKKKTGTCCTFDVFRFPDRILGELRKATNRQDISLEEAEILILDHSRIKEKFTKEYKDIFYNSMSISFVEIQDERDLFYTEALAIGMLRPLINHA